MNLRRMNSNLVLAVMACSGLAGSAACGGEAPTSAEPAVNMDAPADTVGVLGVATGTYRNGRIEIGPLNDVPGAGAPGAEVQNFGSKFSQSKITFATLPGDGVGTGTCTATQDCGTVTLTNNTGVTMDNTFVEITDYFGVAPTGQAITWAGTPFTLSSTYASAFKNSGKVEAANYGTVSAGQSKNVEFKWNIGTATTFSFHVKVLASFRRPTWSGNLVTGSVASQPTDACAIGGSTKYFAGGDDGEQQVQLPFAYTFFDLTYDRAVVSPNGYFLPYSTGAVVPTTTQNNVTMVTSTLPVGWYVFWDDLAYDGTDGVCVATTGTTPNRVFVVTWKNAKISTSQPAKGTWTTQKLTFSLSLRETDDFNVLAWGLPTGGIVDQTRGSTATIGFRAILNGKAFPYNFGNGSKFLPAAAGSYPTNTTVHWFPANP